MSEVTQGFPESTKNAECTEPEIALAYVGSIVPDIAEYHNAAFSRAGVMFQQNLLYGLKRAGLTPSAIFSVQPLSSFPRGEKLWVGKKKTQLGEGLLVSLLPYLNLTPLKQIMIGFVTLSALLVWGWRTRRVKHRIVYTFNLTVPPGLFTLIGARCIGAKAMVSLNDIHEPEGQAAQSFFHHFDYWLQKKLIPFFDGHIAVADKIMTDFAPGKSYLRLEGGITSEMLKRSAKVGRSNEKEDEPFVIVSAGRLDEINGIRVLLESFSYIPNDRYRLRIAGTGPLENEVRRAATNDSRIEYCGFLPLEEVLDLYASADLLINMRLTEGRKTDYFFPSKLMEYLASGTPVATTCSGHAEEEFGDFVFLLRDESALGLADAMRNSASLPTEVRKNLGERAREYMAKNKTWDAHGTRLLEYIQEKVL